jgi:hypothetical protein
MLKGQQEVNAILRYGLGSIEEGTVLFDEGILSCQDNHRGLKMKSPKGII